MRPINELPGSYEIDDEIAREIIYEAGFKNQYTSDDFVWKAVKLAYKFGYQRCANLHFV